jgi:hypothetical protein
MFPTNSLQGLSIVNTKVLYSPSPPRLALSFLSMVKTSFLFSHHLFRGVLGWLGWCVCLGWVGGQNSYNLWLGCLLFSTYKY